MTLMTYLLITGIGAVIALVFPSLVAIGMLLIVPGLILALMPSAFLYGLVFAGFRLLLGGMLDGVPLDIAAALATAALMWVIPQPTMRLATARLAKLRQGDIIPPAPIALSGHVFIRQPWGKGCDALCAALLKTPGVLSVTRAPVRGKSMTYRLVSTDTPGESITPAGFGFTPPSKRLADPRLADRYDMEAEWNLMLSSLGLKLIGREENITPDFTLVMADGPVGDTGLVSRRSINWSLRASEVHRTAFEILDREGTLLLRQAILSSTMPSAPLFIGTIGGLENFRFQFARKRIGDGTESSKIPREALLLAHTTIARGVDKAAVGRLTRSVLEAELGDPARSAEDAAFKLANQWMKSQGTATQPFDADERALLVRILEDRRVASAEGLSVAVKRIADPAPDLRRLAVARYLSAPDFDKACHWVNALSLLPPGAYATALPEELEVLASPRTSIHATGLITRQADRGEEAIPDLLRLLRDYSTFDPGKNRYSDVTSAAGAIRSAFRAIGPDAAPARAEIEALLVTPGLARGYEIDKREWDVVLVMLGKPVSTLEKPERLTGTVEDYRERIAALAEKYFDPRSGR